jgi:hypothetical protein
MLLSIFTAAELQVICLIFRDVGPRAMHRWLDGSPRSQRIERAGT